MPNSSKKTHEISSVDLSEASLDELTLESGDAELIVDLFLSSIEPVAPLPATRKRLMDAVAGPSRLMRFAAKIAEMADITLETARGWLRRLDGSPLWEGGVLPGVEVIWIDGGPAAACAIRGFVKIAEGHTFPPHRHLGHETTLILEGEYFDSNGDRHGPGDLFVRDLASEHGFRAGNAEPLLMFNVVFEGICVGDMVFKHRDEEAE